MRVYFQVIVLVPLAAFSVGCGTLKTTLSSGGTDKKFVLKRSWARHTTEKDYLGARINQVMEPLLFSGMVIQGNEIDGIQAYGEKSGQKIWRRKIDGGVTAGARERSGVLYFGAGDGFFYALDARTGQTRWSFPIKSEGIGAPLVTEDAVYFLAGNNAAYALKIDSGEQIWYYSRVDSANISVRGASEPSISGDRLYLGFSDGYLVALDKNKGTLVWERQLGTNVRFHDVDSKPVIDGSRIYVSSYDGQLYCLDISKGQTIWVNEEGGFTPVTLEGDRLYYSTSMRKVMALDKSSGKVIWSRDLKSTVAGQPVLHRGLLLVGEWSGSLRALDQTTGRDVTKFNTGRGVTSKPTLDPKSDYVYVMTADANLFALKLHLKDHSEDWPWEK